MDHHAKLGGGGLETRHDGGLAFLSVGQHEVGLQIREPTFGADHGDGPAIAAVPHHGAAGLEPSHGGDEALPTQHCADAVDRTGPALGAAAPAQGLLEGDGEDGVLEPSGQLVGGGLATLADLQGHDGAAGALELVQIIDAGAAPTSEALGGLGEGAVAEGHGPRGTRDDLLDLGTSQGHVVHSHRDATGAVPGAHGAVGDALEQLGDVGSEHLASGGAPPGGELFAVDLDEQLGGAHDATSSSFTPSQAAAHLHASSRMRRMYSARSATEMAPRASSRLNRWLHWMQWS